MFQRIQVLEHNGGCPGDHMGIRGEIDGGNTWVGVIHGFCEMDGLANGGKSVGHFLASRFVIEVDTVDFGFLEGGSHTGVLYTYFLI
jgi:hypothetical protein